MGGLSKQNLGLISLFFLSVGLILGLGILLLVAVPVEERLQMAGLSQGQVDLVMLMIILAWAILTGLLTVIFYRRMLLRPGKRTLGYLTVGVLAVLSMLLFALMLSTDNSVIAAFLSGEVEENTNIYGPYPDQIHLQKLKAQGVTGVITLLNPAIPFEKVLLEREKTAASKLGLKLYSFPMLPWVSSNRTALGQIRELISREEGTYYIHCYLGRHRVNLVKQALSAQAEPTQDEYLYPDALERGRLNYYQQGRIILGPFPTQQEWFNLVARGGVKEVVSYLDPQEPQDIAWIKQERQICSQMGISFRLFSVPDKNDNYLRIEELGSYLLKVHHKVFVHGYNNDNRARMLDGFLRYGVAAWDSKPIAEATTAVNLNLYLGPRPDEARVERLKLAGVTEFIDVGAWPQSQSNLSDMAGVVQTAVRIEQSLAGKKGIFYLYGVADPLGVGQVLSNRLYGLGKTQVELFSKDKKVSLLSNRLMVGTMPTVPEVTRLGAQGVGSFMLLQGRGEYPSNQANVSSRAARQMGLNWVTINYGQDYTQKILAEVRKAQSPHYLIVPPEALAQVSGDLLANKLY